MDILETFILTQDLQSLQSLLQSGELAENRRDNRHKALKEEEQT